MDEKVMVPERARTVGGTGEGTNKVYISKNVYKTIYAYAKAGGNVQVGGILLGNTLVEDDVTYIIVRGFIEAKHAEINAGEITFTKETWRYVDDEKAKLPEYDTVGWMHANPDGGCIPTEYDEFFHVHLFEKEGAVEYIIDPIQIEEGFYFYSNGKMTKTDGFYLFTEAQVKKQVEKSQKRSKTDQYDDFLIMDDTQVQKFEEEEMRTIFQTAEKKVEENKDDIEKNLISERMELPDMDMVSRSSVRMKVFVSSLMVLVLLMGVCIGVMAYKIVKLEKSIQQLYENDEIIAKYINTGEVPEEMTPEIAESEESSEESSEEITEEATEAITEAVTEAENEGETKKDNKKEDKEDDKETSKEEAEE